MKKRLIATALVAAMLIGTIISASGCSSEGSADGKTHITLLQYKPEAVKAFEKMQKMEEEAGAGSRSAMEKMFSSHPDTPARIKHMSERATKDGYTRP